MIIVNQQCGQGSGESFPAGEEHLRRPDMTGNNCQHGQAHQSLVSREVVCGPYNERAFAEITQQRDQKATPAQDPADVLCADTTAAQIAWVLARAHADEVITSSETA